MTTHTHSKILPLSLLVLLLFSLSTPLLLNIQFAYATDSTFGYTSVGDQNIGVTANQVIYTNFTATYAGTVTALNYWNAEGGTIKLAIYSANSTLVYGDNTGVYTNAGNWVHKTGLAVYIPAGNYYLAAKLSDAETKLSYYDSGSTNQAGFYSKAGEYTASWESSLPTFDSQLAYKFSIYANYTYGGGGGDVTAPTFGTISANTTYAGNATRLSVTAADNVALSGGLASTNNTGAFVNQTWQSSSGAMTYDFTWNTTAGNTVAVIWYANDTSNNWGTSTTTYFSLINDSGNLVISSSDVAYTGGSYNSVRINTGLHNITLDGLTVGAEGIYGSAVINSTIKNSVFPRNGSNLGGWITLEGNSNNNLIMNNTIIDGDIWYDGFNGNITMNYLYGNDTRGEIWTYTNAKNVSITKNMIYPYIDFSGLGGNYGENIYFGNNTVIGKGGTASDCINLASMINVTIIDNIIINGTKNAVNFDISYSGLIQNNTISYIASGYTGIKGFAPDNEPLNFIIQNNTITGDGVANVIGIGLNTATNAIIRWNTLNGLTNNAISIYSTSSNVTVQSNTIIGSATGLSFDGSVTQSFLLNNTVGATNGIFMNAQGNEIAYNDLSATTTKVYVGYGSTFDDRNYWHDNGIPGEPLGQAPEPTATPTPVPTVTSTPGYTTSSANYFFQSATQTVNNVTGFKITENTGWSETSVARVFTGTGQISYGFRAWIVHSNGDPDNEITGGTPESIFSRTTDGEGLQNSTISISTRSLVVGLNSIKVVMYIRFEANEWLAIATFTSSRLMEKQINSGTWGFFMYTKYESSTGGGGSITASAYWGGQNSRSGISGVEFTDPLPQEVALYTGMSGNFIGMIGYPYTYLFGSIFYGIVLLGVMGNLYLRHKKIEVILIWFVLWGSTSGFGLLIPSAAFRVIYVILLLAIAVILYKLFR